MKYGLTVTQYAVDASSVEILQNDVFEHNSTIKHGLQRKATDVVLSEDHRESFASAKWTNEDVDIDGETVRMMHKSVFTAESTMQLVLRQVSDDAEVTIETTSRTSTGEKHPFAVEVQEQADGQLNVVSRKIIHAANETAAKLQLNGDYEAYEGKWSKMPYGGIYRTNPETGQIVVLRPLSAEEAAELSEESDE